MWQDVGFFGKKGIFMGMLTDPVRRHHTACRIVESLLPALTVLHREEIYRFLDSVLWLRPLTLHLPTWAWAVLIVGGEFLLYELVLEPYFRAGPYWERGPREDEIFQELIPQR